jgi:hypothetical protein
MYHEEINKYLEQIGSLRKLICRAEGKTKDLLLAQLRPIANGALNRINAEYPDLIPAYKVWLDFANVGLKICEYAVSTVERILRIKYDPQYMECGIDTVFEDKGIVCFVNFGNNKISSEQLFALQEALGWPSVFSIEPTRRNGQNGLKLKFDVLSSRCLSIYESCRQCGLTDVTQDS